MISIQSKKIFRTFLCTSESCNSLRIYCRHRCRSLSPGADVAVAAANSDTGADVALAVVHCTDGAGIGIVRAPAIAAVAAPADSC